MEEEKRLLMIVNPCAGVRKGLRALPKLHRFFESCGYRVTDHVTSCAGDGLLVAERESGQYDLVVCVGGDGTLNEVMSGVLRSGSRTAFGYIPTGSTNDFARSLGISRRPRRAARAIAEGEATPLDIGMFGERNFSYIASFGAFARTSYSVPQRLKNLFGRAAYILRGIADVASIKPIRIRIESAECTLEDEFIFGAISNATSFGGLLKLDRSDVDFCDGKFEVMLIRPMKNPHQLSKCIGALASKKYGENDRIVFFHTEQLIVHAPSDMPWTLDGEYACGAEAVHISCLRHALQIVGRRATPSGSSAVEK